MISGAVSRNGEAKPSEPANSTLGLLRRAAFPPKATEISSDENGLIPARDLHPGSD